MDCQHLCRPDGLCIMMIAMVEGLTENGIYVPQSAEAFQAPRLDVLPP